MDRVLRPFGLLAVWSYDLCRMNAACDEVVGRLYGDILDRHWPAQRRTVEGRYRDIVFPYREVKAPALTMEKRWTREQLVAYLKSWSAVRRYRKQERVDPLRLVASDLERAWGGAEKQAVHWPLTLIIRRK